MELTRIAITPESHEQWLAMRAQDLTSTDVAALFDCSPYQSHFELWHRKRHAMVVELEDNERLKWGRRLEPAIATGLAEDHGLRDVHPMKDYWRIPELRLGSSFDYAVGDDGLIEAKNVDALAFKEGWLVEGDEVEAPPHIELQAQHQLLVSGRKWCAIGALVGGNRGRLNRREPDLRTMNAIVAKASQFWASIERNEPPPPELPRDTEFISYLYRQSNGVELDTRELDDLRDRIRGLAEAYRFNQQLEKQHKDAKEAIKGEILMLVKEVDKVIGDGFTISMRTVQGGREVKYVTEPYRGFRVNWKKENAG